MAAPAVITAPERRQSTGYAEQARITLALEQAMAKGGWQEFTSAASLQRPAEPAAAATPKAQQRVRVQRTKAGKGGKLVTAISGLEAPEAELKALLKTLKASAGTGGTLKDELIELQGDQVAIALEALTKAGYRPKQAGG
jgi:translation initiation factor 1